MLSHNSCRCAKFLHYCSQTPSHIACLNRCKGTIAADVQISLLNDFQTSSQIAYLTRCKVTLVACVWFSQMLVFTCLLKSPASKDAKSQELQMCKNSPLLFSSVFSNRLIEQMQSHISCMCVVFSNVSFHVSFQITCLNRCKVTRVADMRNFSIKWFSNVFSNRLIEQMQSHISCMCVVFSNVSFHVSSQMAWLNRCEVALVACVWFSQM